MNVRFMPALVLTAALVVSGCVSISGVSRDTADPLTPVVADTAVLDWDVIGFDVSVPETLTTSEANTIKPQVDIVWHEEPFGDRHMQVDDLMTAALEPAFAAVTGSVPVIVSMEVTRFHAQTHRVRYSNIPSEQEIEFVLLVSHAETGEILLGPREVDLTFPALGGSDAIAADARGETQRARISQRLLDWVNAEFIDTPDTSDVPSLVASN